MNECSLFLRWEWIWDNGNFLCRNTLSNKFFSSINTGRYNMLAMLIEEIIIFPPQFSKNTEIVETYDF